MVAAMIYAPTRKERENEVQKLMIGVFSASVALTGVANAADLVAGLYGSYGAVASATSQCSAVGLSQGSGNFAELKYPGNGNSGLIIYTPAFGILQRCVGFAPVPAGGLNGYSSNASCATYSSGGNLPAEKVNFSFTSTTTDANSSYGTTTITIPASDPVGGGCTATINAAVVRTGK